MKLFTVVFLLATLAFVSADVTTMKLDPENLTTTAAPKPPITTTTHAPITTPTPSTTSTTTTTTEIPSTTTPTPPPTPPTSTTTKPTPAPAPTPTTPPAPTPTTPPAPITTPAPPTPTTPAPKPTPKEPEIGKWNLNYTKPDNTTSQFYCMTVQMALQTEVHYNTTSNSTEVGYINLPKNATVNGTCGSDPKGLAETMTLNWDGNNNVTLNFKKNNASSKFYLDQVLIVLGNLTELPNSKLTSFNLVHDHAEFNTTAAKSYKCDKIQNFKLSGAESKTEIHVSHVQMQAFTNTTNAAFHEAEDCQPFETPDVVPIAVGCSLVVLVLVVLAAYLVGRRRREGQGYLSM